MKFLLKIIYLNLAVIAVADALPLELLKQLENEDYLERIEAHKLLEDWIKQAQTTDVEALQDFSEQAESPEVKLRLIDLLKGAYLAVPDTRGFIGVALDPMLGGAIVSEIAPGQPAGKFGLKLGDIVLKVDEKDLVKMKGSESHAMKFLRGYVLKKNEGEKLELKILRGNKNIDIELRLGNYDKYVAEEGRRSGIH